MSADRLSLGFVLGIVLGVLVGSLQSRGRHRLRDHRQQTSKKQHQAHEIPLGIPSGGK